jgi:tRNA (adenine-N(1)-)-methyltransferase non-catalytic subunit
MTQEEQPKDETTKQEEEQETAPKEDVTMTDTPTNAQSDPASQRETADKDMKDATGAANGTLEDQQPQQPEAKASQTQTKKRPRHYEFPDLHIPYAGTNTITLLHANNQPNLNFLKYYDYDISVPHPPFATHALYSNLICVNWLQILDPEQDSIYTNEPAEVDPIDLIALKPSRRGIYHRKRRRWARTRYIVDSTRAGGFSGLAVASTMDPISILRYAVPLLAPGAPIAIYSPCVEPLTKLADCYSTARRSAWANDPPDEAKNKSSAELESWPGTEDFPLNPSLLLGAAVQTSSARKWQVLPGRTHPMMTGRGGAQGYVFTAWRALPASGKVEARGKFKRKKAAAA